MQKLVWQNANGDSIDLTSGNYGITQWEGFSNASLNIQSQQVPFQDGAVFLDALLNQRELSVTLKMQDNGNLEERYRMRRELIHILNPKLGEGYLIYTNDFISKRIKCVAQIPLFETHNSDTRGTPKASLSWIACEPYWEDLEETIVIFDTLQQTVINNEGDIPINFQAKFLMGNAKKPMIKNITTHKFIAYNGTVNKKMLIDTQVGQKGAYILNDIFKIKNYFSNFYGVVYFKNKVVFAGGLCFWTEDFQNFQYIPIINVQPMHEQTQPIATDGTKLAIVTESYIYISEDLINWKRVNEGFGSIIYSQSKNCFYAIRFDEEVYKSIDLENWDFVTGGEESYFEKLFDINGNLLTSSYTDLSKINDDGTLTSVFSGYVTDIIYENNEYLLLSDKKIYSSSNLSNWTEKSTDLTCDICYSFLYYNLLNCFLILGNDGLYRSYNLTNWVKFDDEVYNTGILQSISEFGKVIFCNSGKIKHSTDLNTWGEFSGTNLNLSSIDTCFNKVICCCKDNIIKLTEDSWTEMLSDSNAYYKKIIPWKNGKGLLYSEHKIYESSDGDNWNLLCSFNEGSIDSLCATENALVVISAERNVYISTDFENWTQLSGIDNASTIATNGDYFILGNINYGMNPTSYIYKITNDGTISLLYSDFTDRVNSIVYDKKRGVFICDCDGLCTSANGVSWDKVNQTNASNLKIFNDILYGITTDGLSSAPNLIFWLYDSKPFNTINDYAILGDKIYFINGDNIVIKEGEESDNVINNLTYDSDIGLALQLGKNELILSCEKGSTRVELSYRQKYIGV